MIIKSIIFASAVLMSAPSQAVVTQTEAPKLSSAEIEDLLNVNRQECTLIRDLGGWVCEYECPGVPGTIFALCGTL
ncbi:MAG: hypothetical protein AAF269_02880 [Pseudomonadota bacterium]